MTLNPAQHRLQHPLRQLLIGLMHVDDAEFRSTTPRQPLPQELPEILQEKNRLIDSYRHAAIYAEDLSGLHSIEAKKQQAKETLNEILLAEFGAWASATSRPPGMKRRAERASPSSVRLPSTTRPTQALPLGIRARPGAQRTRRLRRHHHQSAVKSLSPMARNSSRTTRAGHEEEDVHPRL